MNALKAIVNHVFDVDILNPSRKRELVNARITFAHILREKGFTTGKIGGFLNKDHATILHYCKNVEWYLKTDVDFKRKYNVIFGEFQGDEEIVEQSITDSELNKQVFLLKNENKLLSLEHNGLKKDYEQTKSELEELKNHYKRIQNLIKIVDERTRRGTEEQIELRLNQFYNGVYSR